MIVTSLAAAISAAFCVGLVWKTNRAWAANRKQAREQIIDDYAKVVRTALQREVFVATIEAKGVPAHIHWPIEVESKGEVVAWTCADVECPTWEDGVPENEGCHVLINYDGTEALVVNRGGRDWMRTKDDPTVRPFLSSMEVKFASSVTTTDAMPEFERGMTTQPRPIIRVPDLDPYQPIVMPTMHTNSGRRS